jgi:NAD-dependent SIR2 family protein deacetylase
VQPPAKLQHVSCKECTATANETQRADAGAASGAADSDDCVDEQASGWAIVIVARPCAVWVDECQPSTTLRATSYDSNTTMPEFSKIAPAVGPCCVSSRPLSYFL